MLCERLPQEVYYSSLRGMRLTMNKAENMAMKGGWYPRAWLDSADGAEDCSTNLVHRQVLLLEEGDGSSAGWHFEVLLLLLGKLAVVYSQLQ